MARVRNFSTMTAAAVALVTVGIVASGCSPTKEAASTATATTEASAEKLRTRRQGRNDFMMSLVAAVGATGA
mgnify:CR=1 FL=1